MIQDYLSLADTRTNDALALGSALLQHQHSGVLPSSTEKPLDALPLLDPIASSSMPESWVRGAILIRMNSLIRGHSGVRWELIEKMSQLLDENITPMVSLRGSISASGGMYFDIPSYLLKLKRSLTYRSFALIIYRRHPHRQPFYSSVRRSLCLWRS